eukprot:CAMPEP_0197239790 /NCGR_PEP_ID=MMETSP1429-20130617/6215_1 /TAXON_ID=49237 /ORGANISM="Chaetoceros  sp., Strain UNC1202" /LENGTH=53 /DNA_ID=CAMNT_0042699283 /DNA_START=54 /DNA_END=212 /DNA_ORIENTATION=+
MALVPNFECSTSIIPEAIHEAGVTSPLIGSIDQGTSSTRFLLFTRLGRIAASA